MGLDRSILDFVVAHRSGTLTGAARALMGAGTSRLVLGVLGITGVGVVLAFRWYRAGMAALGALVVAVVSSDLLKILIGRPRPPRSLALVHLPAGQCPRRRRPPPWRWR